MKNALIDRRWVRVGFSFGIGFGAAAMAIYLLWSLAFAILGATGGIVPVIALAGGCVLVAFFLVFLPAFMGKTLARGFNAARFWLMRPRKDQV